MLLYLRMSFKLALQSMVCVMETGILLAGLIGVFHTDWGLSFNNMKGAELPLPAYSSTQSLQAERDRDMILCSCKGDRLKYLIF